jgi:hypothetical protein
VTDRPGTTDPAAGSDPGEDLDTDTDPGSQTRLDPDPWTRPHPSGLPWASGVTVISSMGDVAAQEIDAFERFRGRPIDIYNAFANHQGTWEQYLEAFFWTHGLPEVLARRRVLVVMSIAPVVERYDADPNGNEGIRRAARGDYDRFHEILARRIRGYGWRRPNIIRLGWEPSQQGRAYSYALDAAADYANYKAMMRRIATIYRGVLDPDRRGDCLIDWCNLRRPTTDPRPAYPGNDVVDIIGMDMYGNAADIGYPTGLAEFDRTYLRRRGPGGAPWSVEAWQTFARNHGKPIAIDESGVTNPQGPNRPADWATWVRGMFRFYRANHGADPGELLYEIYFNRVVDYAQGNGAHVIVPADVNPEAAAEYRDLYHP